MTYYPAKGTVPHTIPDSQLLAPYALMPEQTVSTRFTPTQRLLVAVMREAQETLRRDPERKTQAAKEAYAWFHNLEDDFPITWCYVATHLNLPVALGPHLATNGALKHA